jgi:hypothetical protein
MSIIYSFKLSIPAETSCKSFFYFMNNVKRCFDIYFNDLMSKVRRGTTPPAPCPFRFTGIAPTQGQEKSGQAMFRSLAGRQSGIQSDSGMGPYRPQGAANSQLSLLSRSFLLVS